MNQLPFQCNIWLIFTICKSTSLFQSTENSSGTIFHLQVVDYRVFYDGDYLPFLLLQGVEFTQFNLYGELGFIFPKLRFKLENILGLPFTTVMKFKQRHCLTISYIIIFEINFLQNNRNLFYILYLAGIDHKTTMGRIAAASPTAEEQNKQSPSKPKITLHSPKHDIKSSFRSAGIQVQDQFVLGNLKKWV